MNQRQEDRNRNPGAGRSSHGGGTANVASSGQEIDAYLGSVNLREPSADMFDQLAEKIAANFVQRDRVNAPSQIRRFYDELVRYDDRHRANRKGTEAFRRDLPFIRMISAHVAYARQRKLVDDGFMKFVQACIRKVESPDDLSNFRTLFEAVIGFIKK